MLFDRLEDLPAVRAVDGVTRQTEGDEEGFDRFWTIGEGCLRYDMDKQKKFSPEDISCV